MFVGDLSGADEVMHGHSGLLAWKESAPANWKYDKANPGNWK